jgi:hypothetical protein
MKRRDLILYSFRHTYKKYIRKIQSDETANRLMGHAPTSVGEMYGRSLDESEMKLFCENFSCPIDLSHLYRV